MTGTIIALTGIWMCRWYHGKYFDKSSSWNSKSWIMNIERRKFARYHLPNDAIFLYSNHSPINGWVKNISCGGMAFEYTQGNKCEIKSVVTFILMADKLPFYLPDIPCKVIHDVKYSIFDEAYKGTGIRRCGVQFGKLNLEIRKQLTSLLNSELVAPYI